MLLFRMMFLRRFYASRPRALLTHTAVRIVCPRVTLRLGCAFALPPLSPLGYNSISLAMMVTPHRGSLAREDK